MTQKRTRTRKNRGGAVVRGVCKIDPVSTTRKRGRTSPSPSSHTVAIVVPFRDLDPAGARTKQLARFTEYMQKYMGRFAGYKIWVVEQSADDRKFNRGKLLNIGFALAAKAGAKQFIFHDVDLLPSAELRPYYSKVDPKRPIHIARVWKRYTGAQYFGGVTSVHRDQFRQMNGFPNNFWGWGGEDDELYLRSQSVGLTIDAPKKGSMQDLEEMDLAQKMAFLRQNKLKCMNQYEVLDEHDATWRANGLADLHYTVLERRATGPHLERVLVDVGLNGGHWTDRRVGLGDTACGKLE